MDSEVFSSIVSLHEKIDKLTKTIGKLPCAVNDNRVKNLEKVVYGACKIILVAFIIAVISITYNKTLKASVIPIIKKIEGINPHRNKI